MKKTFKSLMLGALLASSVLVASAHAAVGSWTLVTPTLVIGGIDNKNVTNVYWTDLTSGTLNSDNLLLGGRSCTTMDFKTTSATTVDSLTIIGYPTSPTAAGWPGVISTTFLPNAIPTVSGTHSVVTGAPRVVQARLSPAAGSGQRTTIAITEHQNCTR